MLEIWDTRSFASASEEISISASQLIEASEIVVTSCTYIANSFSGQINVVSGASNEINSFVMNI